MPKLGINIDHVVTLRQARGGRDPDPVYAAVVCELAGADSIVAHLREDRRHINDNDVKLLREVVKTKFNLEMSIDKNIVAIAKKVLPDEATLVPEKRKELTTEGGLDIVKGFKRIKLAVEELKSKAISVSLFIDPVKRQIEASKQVGADFIELHTGIYAESKSKQQSKKRLKKIIDAVDFAHSIGIRVNAGHGLNYSNTTGVAQISGIEELNIGHSVISRAIFVGLPEAVRQMKVLARG